MIGKDKKTLLSPT